MKTSSKLSLFVGLAAGYVLGARAGRERYEQIVEATSKVWNSKPVQKQADKAAGLVEKYVPAAVEGTFSALGKGASKLVGIASHRDDASSNSSKGSANRSGSNSNNSRSNSNNSRSNNNDAQLDETERPVGSATNPAH